MTENDDFLDFVSRGDFSFFGDPEADEKKGKKEEEGLASRRFALLRTKGAHSALRALSEAAFSEAAARLPEDGETIHVVTAGDIDLLTFVRWLVRMAGGADYCLCSAWCFALKDAKEIAGWTESGVASRMDFYCGEIFKGEYYSEADRTLLSAVKATGGRLCRFRNHSKVAVVFGRDGGAYVAESSANVDTNPRTEQTALTRSLALAEFYKGFFDGFRDFDGRDKKWMAWKVPEKFFKIKRHENKARQN